MNIHPIASSVKKSRTDSVQTVAYDLPMAYNYLLESFYIRACYLLYYDLISNILDSGKRYISVTGTPGIGKSVFYLYFFHRFRRENSKNTIIVASFNKKNKLMRCKVFDSKMVKRRTLTKIPDIPGAIHFYDGTPEYPPPSDQQLVCFTSPNSEWLEYMEKALDHTPIYMPSWTLEELYEARNALNLPLTSADIESRFCVFGGIARFCLCLDLSSYEETLMKFMRKIKAIDSYQKLADLLDESCPPKFMCHRIFHFIPKWTDGLEYPRFYEIRFASDDVFYQIQECIGNRNDEERRRFVDMIKAEPLVAPLVGHMFEAECRRFLSRGGEFCVFPLSNGVNAFRLKLKEGDFKATDVANFPAIDGYFFDEGLKCLYCFQMTIAQNHPVKIGGFKIMLEFLGLTKLYDSIDIRLIFLVPEGMEDFKMQGYDRTEPIHIDSDVSLVDGIGPKFTEQLNKQGICTIRDLLVASDANKIHKKYTRLVSLCREQLNEDSCLVEKLARIPQYLISTSLKYK